MVNRGAGGILGRLSQAFHEGTVAGLTDAQTPGAVCDFGRRRGVRGVDDPVRADGPGGLRRRLATATREDAFQATFLVLVRKASSIRCRPIDRPLDSRGRLEGRRAARVELARVGIAK